jgi:hypothetical protein
LFERGEILVWRNLLRNRSVLLHTIQRRSLADEISLRIYYATNPSAPKNRCPTWVFLTAATKAFEGSGQLEDGTVSMEDIICVIASLIDQVYHAIVIRGE